jgi:hypothetical protein
MRTWLTCLAIASARTVREMTQHQQRVASCSSDWHHLAPSTCVHTRKGVIGTQQHPALVLSCRVQGTRLCGRTSHLFFHSLAVASTDSCESSQQTNNSIEQLHAIGMSGCVQYDVRATAGFKS